MFVNHQLLFIFAVCYNRLDVISFVWICFVMLQGYEDAIIIGYIWLLQSKIKKE